MGTLDPLASGVLVVGINKGTKLFDRFLKHDKEYYAEYQFGYETDTLDLEGQVLNRDENVNISKENLEKLLPLFLGKQQQMPPAYSAKKINGQKACDLVRAGKEVNLTPKEVDVYDLKLVKQVAKNTFGVKIACSSGFYVRALGRDLAKQLGTYCTTICIRRTKCCGFDLTQAQTLNDIKAGKAVVYPID